MDIILSVPNRFHFHQQDRPSSVLFAFQLCNGIAAPVVGQQHSSGEFICNSLVPTNAPERFNGGSNEVPWDVHLLQENVHMRDEGESVGWLCPHSGKVLARH